MCTTTVAAAAAVVSLLVLGGGLRLMEHILSRPRFDASVQRETGEGGRGKERVVNEGKQEGDGDREVEGEEKMWPRSDRVLTCVLSDRITNGSL